MRKILSKSWIGFIILLGGCNVFGPVDPLPPTFSALELVSVNRSQITVKGAIQGPSSKNDRQEKKSGKIQEYGLVYGETESLDIQANSVITLDSSVVETLPVTVEQTISGLKRNTDYYVALYARNEGGGVGYSEILKVNTENTPAERINQKSVTIKNPNGYYFDLDAGTVNSVFAKQSDGYFDLQLVAQGSLAVNIYADNGLILKELGAVDYDKIDYTALLNVRDYERSVRYLAGPTTANKVIVFKTLDGRYGKWKIESISFDALVMSLVTYDN